MKTVSIIILNWNGKQNTVECLESVGKLQITNYKLQIIVVDNGSTDGSVEEIKNETLRRSLPRASARGSGQELKIIENKENLGFAEGNNVGIKYALENGVDYVVLLNNDTLVEKNLIEELLKVADLDPQVGVISPKIYFVSGFEFHKDRYKEDERGKVIWYTGGKIDWQNVLASHRGVDEVDRGQYDKEDETDFATGCCMLVKKEVFEKIGFLDKKYFVYWEDTDFCQRARKVGYKIFYAPQAFLWHKNAASSDKPGSSTHVYYQTRNRLLFGFHYASLRAKLALVRESLRFLMEGGIRRKAVLDFYLGRLGRSNNIK